eukprot:CAMPEP_0113553406 /NCGR_PEP_ID=MMETSP0015_2-20120614/15595_1 /TAXON_ID=2838 /ORGANISM="Odontella" /LENGTH=479 /DNA_ID=CAMNT_0000454471 /DNA_START=55 /DNA_END=1494 /DNA_ORIENTATION=+ /assembly_acc=CAM_ASM_000160
MVAEAVAPTPPKAAAAAPSGPTEDNGSLPIHDEKSTPGADEPSILLYYCYTPHPLPSVPSHIAFQRELCLSLGLNGRIRVSSEGINGVLSSYKQSDLEDYVRRVVGNLGDGMTEDEFDAKYCHLRKDIGVEEQMFDALSVKSTREVVSLWEPGAEEQRSAARARAKALRRRRRNEKMADKEGGNTAKVTQSHCCSLPVVPSPPNGVDLGGYIPAPHLSPQEWNDSLLSLAISGEEAILIDARNVYESRVGHFRVPGVPTLLTNTRKYSSLPTVLEAHKSELAGKHVFMYCTGGVRCERASTYLQALSDGDGWSEGGKERIEKPKGVYQLKGGIQRYLATFGLPEDCVKEQKYELELYQQSSGFVNQCLYKGKNFVFDQRRTDPIIGGLQPVGQCLLCKKPWDDYDNGHSPKQNREARCRRCRILVLVCDECRGKIRTWGENNDDKGDNLPELFCGPGGESCIDEGNFADAVEIIKGRLP